MGVLTSGRSAVSFLGACLTLFVLASQNILHRSASNVALASEVIRGQKIVDPNKPFIVIHTGPPKTGTTTLQVYFKHLEENGVFAKDNYHYDRKVFFEETIMNHSCQRQLMELRQSFKTEDGQYTISELDLADQLRSLPCWANTLEKLQPYLLDRINLFASYEGWSFDFQTIPTENGNSFIDWESMRLTLMPDWNIFVIFAYRRYPEWIFSLFHQMNRPTPKTQNFYVWPDMGGKRIAFGPKPTPLDPLPTSKSDMAPLRFRYSDDLKEEMERNPDIPYAIFNMHEEGGMLSSFVCNAIPNAPHSCKYAIQLEQEQGGDSQLLPSQSLYYDALAVAAYEAGLIDGTRHQRFSIASAIQSHHEHTLNNKDTDFPLICPPQYELNHFLKLSLELEEEIVPEFASSLGRSAEHRASYWKKVEKKKFCWIDTDAVLRDATWLEFFERYQS